MVNDILLDLSIKYGFNEAQINKLVDLAYDLDIEDILSEKFKNFAKYLAENQLIDVSTEEIIELYKAEHEEAMK